MQVSVQVTSGLERRMTIQLPAASVEKEVDSRLRDYAKRARIDGFRPGKVPMKVVRQRFGAQIRHDVLGEMMQKSYYEALAQERLVPAGDPQIEPVASEPGGDFSYTATFEVVPQVELADMAGLSLERVVSDVTDEDVENMVQRIRKQRADWVEVERPAQESDRVVVDYTGRLDGEALEDAIRSDAMVVLGRGRLMPEFEQQLVGTVAGQELDFDVPFPEDYPVEKVAGRTLNFHASVKRVEEERLPEVDAEFAKAFGVEDGDLDELRRRVRVNMVREAQERLSGVNKTRLMDALLAAYQIEVPKIMVEHEVARMQEHQTGPRPPASDVDLAAQAQRRVALGLIIREIVAANSIAVDPARVQRKIESVASTFDDPDAVVRMYRGDKDLMRELEGVVLEDQVVDWVFERAQVTEVRKSFDEVIGTAS